ncbi:hypothetical protein PENPOL_c016G01647 [Penicillium polonicum]|uniref:Uncharacterized protein n=1 Tax=Penicillium polonicum TaxID=60169 RepID=A0A1V6N9Z0_PENPO|nr:hypothetical protein PENPOL_c016G01647 [Penicillium polonicum]
MKDLTYKELALI